jgi:hypothetical protein
MVVLGESWPYEGDDVFWPRWFFGHDTVAARDRITGFRVMRMEVGP